MTDCQDDVVRCFTQFVVEDNGSDTATVTFTSGMSGYLPANFNSLMPYYTYTACPTGPLEYAYTGALDVGAALTSVLGTSMYSGITLPGLVFDSTGAQLTYTGVAGVCTAEFTLTTGPIGTLSAEPCIDGNPGCAGAGACEDGYFPVTIDGMDPGEDLACAAAAPGSSTTGSAAPEGCPEGQFSTEIASAQCSICDQGYFASGTGNSNCLPCSTGTFQDQDGQSTCKGCQPGSYANLPGSIMCVKCVNGRPTECTDTCISADPPSGGSFSAAVTGMSACAWPVAFGVPQMTFFSTCATDSDENAVFTVSESCEVTLQVISETGADQTCSLPGGGGGADQTVILTGGFYYSTESMASATVQQNGDMWITADPTANGGTIWTMTSNTANNWYLNYAPSSATPALDDAILTTSCMVQGDITGGQVLQTANALNCANGSYSTTDTTSATFSCIPAPVGSYWDGPTDIAACPAGTASPILGTPDVDGCLECPAGSFAGEGSGECTPCAVGTYQPTAGSASCLSCPSAQIQGATTCDSCTAGNYLDVDSNSCLPCPAGMAQPDDGATSCNLCPAGETSVAGSSTCTGCLAGFYAPTEGSPECTPCPLGTYAAGASNTGCTGCIAGQYTPTDGASTCVDCEAGYYRATVGSPSSNTCAQCPSGWMTNAATGATACNRCSAGNYSVWQGSTRTPAAGNVCQPCPQGTFAGLAGATGCQQCRAGYDAPTTGATSCTACNTGFYRPPLSIPSVRCTSCAAGSETLIDTAATSCTACSAGYYSGSADSVFCDPCEMGTISANSGATGCSTCLAGQSTVDVGQSECGPCAPGTFNDTPGDDCIDVPAGTYQDRSGQTAYKRCNPASYAPETGYEVCLLCPQGTYANQYQSIICKTCPGGSFSQGAARACTLCLAGTFAPAGSASCRQCARGYYAPSRGYASCLPCPLGKYCPNVGTVNPTNCPAGFYTNRVAQQKCLACPANTYSPSPGSKTCLRCPSGTSTHKRTGQSSCS